MTPERFNYIFYIFFTLILCLDMIVIAMDTINMINHKSIEFAGFVIPQGYEIAVLPVHVIFGVILYFAAIRHRKASEVRPWR